MALSEISAAFATIVGLVADFASRRAQQSNDDYEQFVCWLGENRHEELVRLLNQNGQTAISVKALLGEDRKELRVRLDRLDSMLAQVASGLEGFADLAKSVRPDIALSSQAMQVLAEFVESGQLKALATEFDSKRQLVFFGSAGAQKHFEFDEPRFADDDISALLRLGLLRIGSHNGRGEPIYSLTRLAVEFIRNHARSKD